MKIDAVNLRAGAVAFLLVSAIGCGPFAGFGGAAATPKPWRIEVPEGTSLEAVRNQVRALPASNRVHGVEIVLPPGRFSLASMFQLGAADSGAPRATIVWKGSSGPKRTVVSGGLRVDAASFRPVGDADAKDRIDASVADKILVADLSGLKIKDAGTPKNEFRMPLPVPELYIDGKRMTLAKWPNEGWATIAKFIDEGTKNNDGSVSQGLGYNRKKYDVPRPGTFGYEGDRPSRWTKAPSVWLHGFWCFDWYETVIPVGKIDCASNSITLACMHTYGVRRGNPSPRRWRAVNLLEELDVPGECFFDGKAKKFYLYPPASFSPKSRVTVSNPSLSTFVRADGLKDVILEDIDFEEGHRCAVEMKNCERVELRRCRFRNLRCKAVEISTSRMCGLSSCSIRDTGTGGVTVSGGDRRTLKSSGNYMDNCVIRDYSIHSLTYASAVQIGGVGVAVRNCEISGAPHMAVGLHGNNHLFAYNVVSNVCMASDDAAAFYKGRDPSSRGNVLRYNLWCDIGSPRGHGNAAVYFDDGDGGDLVTGNIFVRCGEPGGGGFGTVFSHGGYSNVVYNCVFAQCKRPLGSGVWPQKRWEDFLKSPLEVTRLQKNVDIRSPAYLARYPELKGYLDPQPDEVRWNAAFNTVFVDCPATLPGRSPGEIKPGICCGRWYTNSSDVAMSLEDARFKDFEHGDYDFRADSKVYQRIPGFRPIPIKKIGVLNPPPDAEWNN